MIIPLTLKDPDGIYDSIRDLATERVIAAHGTANLSASMISDEVEALFDQIREFVQWGEYVTIEIDTDARTAKVVRP